MKDPAPLSEHGVTYYDQPTEGFNPYHYEWSHRDTQAKGTRTVYCFTHKDFMALLKGWNATPLTRFVYTPFISLQPLAQSSPAAGSLLVHCCHCHRPAVWNDAAHLGWTFDANGKPFHDYYCSPCTTELKRKATTP